MGKGPKIKFFCETSSIEARKQFLEASRRNIDSNLIK